MLNFYCYMLLVDLHLLNVCCCQMSQGSKGKFQKRRRFRLEEGLVLDRPLQPAPWVAFPSSPKSGSLRAAQARERGDFGLYLGTWPGFSQSW